MSRGGSVVQVEAPQSQGLVLRTSRMTLRALMEHDRASYIKAIRSSRDQLDAHMPLRENGESDDALFERQLKLSEPAAGQHHTSARYVRLIGVLPGGEVAGGFNINTIMRGLEWSADINWWVAQPLVGAGLATEGVRAIVAHALNDLPAGLGLHIVRAWITPDNPASARVAKKAGFERAGNECSEIKTGGKWVMHELYLASLATIR